MQLGEASNRKKISLLLITLIVISVVPLSGCNEEGNEKNSLLIGVSYYLPLRDIELNPSEYSYINQIDISNPYERAYYGCAEEAKNVLHGERNIPYEDFQEVPKYESSKIIAGFNEVRINSIEYKNGTGDSGIVSRLTTYEVRVQIPALDAYKTVRTYSLDPGFAFHQELFNPKNISIDWDRADLYSGMDWTFDAPNDFIYPKNN